MRLTQEPISVPKVPAPLVFGGRDFAFSDLRPSNLLDFFFAEAQPLNLPGTKTRHSARKMRITAGGGRRTAGVDGFSVVDRAQR